MSLVQLIDGLEDKSVVSITIRPMAGERAGTSARRASNVRVQPLDDLVFFLLPLPSFYSLSSTRGYCYTLSPLCSLILSPFGAFSLSLDSPTSSQLPPTNRLD